MASASAAQEASSDPTTSWSESWDRYVRGNVVSSHAQRLITNVLTVTQARTAADDESTDEEPEQHDADAPVPLNLSLDTVHEVLRTHVGKENDDSKLSKRELQQTRTIRRGQALGGDLCSGEASFTA